jgi:pre-mRNA-splicing factor CDC5/CEF1
MAEAINLRNMTAAQTPLLGDENTPLRGPSAEGFGGATPLHQVAATPNPLATPSRAGQGFGATPRTTAGSAYGQTPQRTPMRDNLSINNDGGVNWDETPREVRLREQQAKRMLQAGFASLPAPENNFEFDEPEVNDAEDDEEPVLTEEDAAERDARLEKLRQQEEERMLARRSTVVKNGLPRPVSVNLQRLVDELAEASHSRPQQSEEIAEADQLIDYELAQLMLHDAIAHPLPGSSVPSGTVSQYEIPEDSFLVMAREEIHKELSQGLGLPGANDAQLRRTIDTLAVEDEEFMRGGWVGARKELFFDEESSAWVEKNGLSDADRVRSYSSSMNKMMDRLGGESAKALKMEKRLGKQLGGYQMINGKLNTRIATSIEALRNYKRDHDSLQILRANEEAVGPRRVEEKREEVARLEKRERDLQGRYADLADQRKAILARIEQVSFVPLISRLSLVYTNCVSTLSSSKKIKWSQMLKTLLMLNKMLSRLAWMTLRRMMQRWRICNTKDVYESPAIADSSTASIGMLCKQCTTCVAIELFMALSTFLDLHGFLLSVHYGPAPISHRLDLRSHSCPFSLIANGELRSNQHSS